MRGKYPKKESYALCRCGASHNKPFCDGTHTKTGFNDGGQKNKEVMKMEQDLHSIWPHRWITTKAKAINSRIHGLGTIAAEPIQKGETIAVLGGIIIHKSQMHRYWKMMGEVGIQVDDDFFICPSSREELEKTGVFNHSCEPNCGFGGTLRLVAMRDIKKGEELVLDYAFSESFVEPFECKCGSPNCRRVIKSDDWKNPALQKKFAEYFSPYLKQKFQS